MYRSTDAGNSWSQLTSPVAADWYGVAFANRTDGWVVGDSGRIYYTNDAGDTWALQTSGTTETLYSANCYTGLYCWAVGANGVVVSTTNGGLTWTKQTLVSGATLDDVWFVNEDTGWVVGWLSNDEPLVYKTADGGGSWTDQSANIMAAGLTTEARGVHFLNTSSGYIVGYDSLYLTTNGGDSFIESVIGDWQRDIYAVDATYLWAAGEWGSVDMSTDGGESWSYAAPAGQESHQNRIWAMNGNEAWVVAEDGKIRHTTDAGSSWADQVTAAGVLQDIQLAHNP